MLINPNITFTHKRKPHRFYIMNGEDIVAECSPNKDLDSIILYYTIISIPVMEKLIAYIKSIQS